MENEALARGTVRRECCQSSLSRMPEEHKLQRVTDVAWNK